MTHQTPDATVHTIHHGERTVRVWVPRGEKWRTYAGNSPSDWIGAYVGRERTREMY